MKILFTGGGTGGHFYPIIAVAEAVHDIVKERKLLEPQLLYAAPDPFDKQKLAEQNIVFVRTSAGKLRRYFSLLNALGLFQTAWGVIVSVLRIFFQYPDVIFSKGGYASFPTLLAARLFRIPVIIHESDTVPGRVNKWAGTFAYRVAVSYPEAAAFFSAEKTAVIGNPIRKNILHPAKEGAHEFLKLEKEVPVLLILGGSQGSMALNNVVLGALPKLTERYQIIHQTGTGQFEEMRQTASVVLTSDVAARRYHPYAYLDDTALRMSAGVASLVISRAGSTIFEIASWGLPSLLIPIPETVVKDQTTNAFSYARHGGAVVIEQNNLTPNVLISEITRVVGDERLQDSMRKAAASFSNPNAARTIAEALLEVALSHEN